MDGFNFALLSALLKASSNSFVNAHSANFSYFKILFYRRVKLEFSYT
jgi:hypothetical protein